VRTAPWTILPVLLLLSACGPRPVDVRHSLVVGNTAVVEALVAFQDAEILLHRAGEIPDDAHRAINRRLAQSFRVAGQAASSLRAWQPGMPMPEQLPALAAALKGLTEEIVSMLPDGAPKTTLLANVAVVYQAVLVFLGLSGGVQ
jgi:hypothetical protein